MFERERERRSVVVARAPNSSEAEFVKLTLAIHGFQGTVSAASVVFPSVDFVQGFQISVSPEEADAARQLLRSLSLTGDDEPA